MKSGWAHVSTSCYSCYHELARKGYRYRGIENEGQKNARQKYRKLHYTEKVLLSLYAALKALYLEYTKQIYIINIGIVFIIYGSSKKHFDHM